MFFWGLTINVTVEVFGTNYIDALFQGDDRVGIGLIIRDCQDEQAAWSSDPQSQWLHNMQGRSFLEIFQFAISNSKDPDLLAFMGWAMWNRRNQLRMNQEACPLNQIIQVFNERREEYQFLDSVVVKPRIGQPQIAYTSTKS
nr:hypothetical protein CFP56_02015 [Quercus suber]